MQCLRSSLQGSAQDLLDMIHVVQRRKSMRSCSWGALWEGLDDLDSGTLSRMVLLVGAMVWASLVKHPQRLSSEHQSLARQVLEFGARKQQQICGLASGWGLHSQNFSSCVSSRKLEIFK